MRILSNGELAVLQEYDEPSNESLGYERNIAKAQHQQDLKDFIEWGEEICACKGEWLYIRRRQCEECWESLKQLVEKDGSKS